MTDFSREGGDPPNNSSRRRLKGARRVSPSTAVALEDLATIIIVAAREVPENRWPTLEVGIRQFIQKHSLLRGAYRG